MCVCVCVCVLSACVMKGREKRSRAWKCVRPQANPSPFLRDPSLAFSSSFVSFCFSSFTFFFSSLLLGSHQIHGKVTYNGSTFDEFNVIRTTAYVGQVRECV